MISRLGRRQVVRVAGLDAAGKTGQGLVMGQALAGHDQLVVGQAKNVQVGVFQVLCADTAPCIKVSPPFKCLIFLGRCDRKRKAFQRVVSL